MEMSTKMPGLHCTSRGEARRRPSRTPSPARSHAPSAAPPARPRGAATGKAPSHARPAPPSRTPGTPAARSPAAARPDPDPRLPSTSASPSVRHTTALPDAAKRSGRAVFACKTSPPNRRDTHPGKPEHNTKIVTTASGQNARSATHPERRLTAGHPHGHRGCPARSYCGSAPGPGTSHPPERGHRSQLSHGPRTSGATLPIPGRAAPLRGARRRYSASGAGMQVE